MPLFLQTREPARREKLILGGAIAFRRRSHRLRLPRHPSHSIKSSPTAALTVSKQHRRAPRQRRHRGLTVKRMRKQQVKKTTKKPRQPLQQTLKKAVTKTGKRVLHQLQQRLGNTASTAKGVLKQLSNSQQIRHAVKDVVAHHNDLPAAVGTHLVQKIVKSRKRPAEENVDETPSTKRGRFAPGFSRIGYRGKQIQRGGTKQQRGGQFLF